MNVEIITVISIHRDEVIGSLVEKLHNNQLYKYEDMEDNESLYGHDLINDFRACEVNLTEQEEKALLEIQQEMDKHAAAYFRIVSF